MIDINTEGAKATMRFDSTNSVRFFLFTLLAVLIFAACTDTGSTAALTPTDEEQIKSTVENYFNSSFR